MMVNIYREFTCVVLVIIMALVNTGTARCKWSNENCESNGECCSEVCIKKHEGMNPRCDSSALSYPCFSSYQCEQGLACSENYTCCTPFWGVCIGQEDCCDRDYLCRREKGFIYKRCLPARGTTQVLRTEYLLILVTVLSCVRLLTGLSSC